MTLLQRAVIQGPRQAGRHDLPEIAKARWPRGQQAPFFGELQSEELRADFDKANQQTIQ